MKTAFRLLVISSSGFHNFKMGNSRQCLVGTLGGQHSGQEEGGQSAWDHMAAGLACVGWPEHDESEPCQRLDSTRKQSTFVGGSFEVREHFVDAKNQKPDYSERKTIRTSPEV